VMFGLARFFAGLGPEWRNDLEDMKDKDAIPTPSGITGTSAGGGKGRDLEGGATAINNPIRGSSGDRVANKSEDSFTF